MNRYIKYLLIAFGLSVFHIDTIKSQDNVIVRSLFEYPSAPEDLENVTDRCNYLAVHFWEPFDFKQKNAVDQNALNHAFNVYMTAIRLCDPNVGLPEIDKLIGKISKNPTLLLQFTKAAEENLYSPRAEFWQDDIYLKFVDALLKNKKIPESRRERYISQEKTILNSRLGQKMPEFKFTGKDNETRKYFPMATPTMIIFGSPDDIDWRMTRLKLETNSGLSQAIDKGKVNVIFIATDSKNDWVNLVSGYSPKWTVGFNDELGNLIDLRIKPSVYVIGADGTIKAKQILPEKGMELLLAEIPN